MRPTASWAPRTPEPVAVTDHLGRLVARTATGDRVAFRRLYAFLAMPAWRAAVRGLPDPADAVAVSRSNVRGVMGTWPAITPTTTPAHGWPRSSPAFSPTGSGPPPHRRRCHAHDVHVRRELHDLLGPGRATIRTSPRTFVSIVDLDDALATIAATTGAPAPHDTGQSGVQRWPRLPASM